MLDRLLDARARRVEQAELCLEDEDIDEYTVETTLQLIFFDGKEVFMAWTATDSIYGARSVPSLSSSPSSAQSFLPLFFSLHRHLAETWASMHLSPHPMRRLIFASTPTTPLSTIEHVVLLDLLGAPHPLVHSYLPDTAWLFDELVRASAT